MPFAKLEEYKSLTDKTAIAFLERIDGDNLVRDAAIYSLRAGGKRIRAALLLGFCEAYGGMVENALPAAAALEYIHTFSLIHDDLPCMDDDDMRRGMPSCHKAYPEATALLAGDALTIAAFQLIADSEKQGLVSKDVALDIIRTFGEYAGVVGMIYGQQQDIGFESSPPKIDELLGMYRHKTCALLKIATKSGVLIAGGDEQAVENALEYAENLGLAFQIIDDILDVTADEQVLGKPTGSDAVSGKTTVVSLLGIEKAKGLAEEYTDKALQALESVPHNTFLQELTKSLLNREN